MIWLPENSNLQGTWIRPGKFLADGVVGSGGAKSMMKPPPPAPSSFPPTAPAERASW